MDYDEFGSAKGLTIIPLKREEIIINDSFGRGLTNIVDHSRQVDQVAN